MIHLNINIPPKNLSDEFLKQEIKDIKKIPICFKKNIDDKEDLKFISQIKTNHLYFFLDKPQYTLTRYLKLFEEGEKRGFTTKNWKYLWDIYDNKYYYPHYKIYKPNKKDSRIAKIILEEKIKKREEMFLHYYSSKLTKKGAIDKLNQTI